MSELNVGDRVKIVSYDEPSYVNQTGTVVLPGKGWTHPDYIVVRMDNPLECMPHIGPQDVVEVVAKPEIFEKLVDENE